MGTTFVKAFVGANLLLVFALGAAGFWTLGAALPLIGAVDLGDCAEVILQAGPSLAAAALCCWTARRCGGEVAGHLVGGAAFAFGLMPFFVAGGEGRTLSGLEKVVCGAVLAPLWMAVLARVQGDTGGGVPRLPPAAGKANSGEGASTLRPAIFGAARRRLAALARLPTAYVVTHWRGGFGLRTSILVNGAAVGLCFWYGVFPVLDEAVSAFLRWHWASDAWDLLIFGNAVWPLAALVVAWQGVGVWRSARRYAGRVWRGWTLGARLAAAALAVGYVHGIAGEAPRLHFEFHQARHAGIVSSSFVAVALDGGDGVLFAGDIGHGAARALGRVLAREGVSARVLYLESRGGYAHEAVEMAEMIRARGLETRTLSPCASACTIVFRAGRVRALGKDAWLGFHRAAQVTDTTYGRERFAASLASVRSVYEEAGAPEWFVARIEATPFETLWRPTKQDLVDAGFVTAMLPDEDKCLRYRGTRLFSCAERHWRR